MRRLAIVVIACACLLAIPAASTGGEPSRAQLAKENARLLRKVSSQRTLIAKLQQPNMHLTQHWIARGFTNAQNAAIASSAMIYAQNDCEASDPPPSTHYEYSSYSGTSGYSTDAISTSPC